MKSVELIVEILVGLSVLIPMLVELIKYIKISVKQKNWTNLIQLVLRLVETAEHQYETGAEKKQWVMSMVKSASDSINFDVDDNTLSDLIDKIVETTKTVNINEEESPDDYIGDINK